MERFSTQISALFVSVEYFGVREALERVSEETHNILLQRATARNTGTLTDFKQTHMIQCVFWKYRRGRKLKTEKPIRKF